ncbi:MAG: hypothetical protein ABSC19_05050, partial [Syntrophorhabdales bacterium]
MLPRLLNIGRTQNGLFEMSAAMLGALLGGGASNVISGLLGSSASSNAATQAAEGQANALSALLSGEQTSQTALSPYYTGGLTDYDTLQYLLGTGGTGGTATWTDADQQQMNQLQASIQGFIGGSNASAKAKYADVLANYQQQYNQLALQKQQYQAQQAAQTAAQGVHEVLIAEIVEVHVPHAPRGARAQARQHAREGVRRAE